MRSSKPALAAALVPQKARSNEDSKDRRRKGADRVELAHLLSGKLPADRAEIFSQLRFVSRADQNGRDCRTLQHPVERDLRNRLPVAWTTSSSALTSVPRRSVTLVEIATSSRRPLMAAPQDGFRCTVRVHVGSVEEVQAGLQAYVQQASAKTCAPVGSSKCWRAISCRRAASTPSCQSGAWCCPEFAHSWSSLRSSSEKHRRGNDTRK